MSFRRIDQMKQHTMAAISIGTAVVGGAQAIGGGIGKSRARKEMNKQLALRKAFQTPEEIADLLAATQMRAGNGLGSETLDFLVEQTDRTASGATSAAMLLGGNPNDLSAIFDQKMNSIMKIGAENHAANIKNFTQYLTALGTMADNKTAEQVSEQNIIKDKIQAASAQFGAAQQTQTDGFNNILGAATTFATGKLYKEPGMGKIEKEWGAEARDYAKANNLSYEQLAKIMSGEASSGAFITPAL